MTTTFINSAVDFYFVKNQRWKDEINLLRNIILECGLTEVLKWGSPCYTFENKNIVLIHVFKEYCAVLFFKGVLLRDTKCVLIQQTENVQAARQMRFTSVEDIDKSKQILHDYIYEALNVEKAGLKVELIKPFSFKIPDELKNKFDKNPAFKKAFDALTPGRQRGYLLHFSSAKQAATKSVRIEKCIPNIFQGKGLND